MSPYTDAWKLPIGWTDARNDRASDIPFDSANYIRFDECDLSPADPLSRPSKGTSAILRDADGFPACLRYMARAPRVKQYCCFGAWTTGSG